MDKMKFPKEIARRFWLCLSVCVMLMAICSVGLAIEEFPDSPSPILISEKDSTRALAVGVENYRGDLPRRSDKTFTPGTDSRVVLFVTNLDLLPDEGANALRVFVEDGKRIQYRMTVESLTPVVGRFGVYAVTVRLFDEIARNGQPGLDGDVLVRLTWRGMTSNRVRLAFGEQGGGPPDDNDAVPTPAPNEKETVRTPKFENDLASNAAFGDRYRFMQQATFGPTSALDLRLRQLGIRRWIDLEIQKPYPSTRYPDLPLKHQNINDPTFGCGATPTVQCTRDNYSMYPMQNWFYKDALYGDGQLRRRVSWSLAQIWVTSGVDVQQGSHMLSYVKILDKNAFGNYRDLMQEVTLHPTMGHYLDMRISTRISPNENYAREILQLFSIGLFMLNQDGTLILQGGQPVATYNQATVDNFTKVFTGWQICQQPAPTCPSNPVAGVPNYIDPMIPIANLHDTTAKTLMNYTQVNGQPAPFVNLPAGQTADTDLNQALDNIFYHPNVGPFVSKLLIQHLVTSDPSPAYVARVSRAFNNDGTTGATRRNGRGNLDSVIKAILTDPEARGSVKTDPNYGKLREPVQFVTHFLKNFNVRSNTGAACAVSTGNQSDGVINPVRNIAGNVVNGTAGMGQNVWNSPTVFNYYPPDYLVPGTDLIGPEFGIYTTGTSFARINFINQMVFGTGLIVDANTNSATYAPCGTGIDLSRLVTIAASDTTGNALIEELNAKMLHGTMSDSMKNTLRTAITAVAATDSLTRVKQAVYLTATSSQYQVQR
jgi:uncharacterized protein (DUF1800 family)